MVGAATGNDLCPAYCPVGSKSDATLRQFACIVVCGPVVFVFSIAVAKTDDRRARYSRDLASFSAFVFWWNGVSAGRVPILRWIGCGCLLAILAMAKGPQPAGFFVLGVLAYLIIGRRWQDLPGWLLCATLPIAATVAWGAAIYQPGDQTAWLAYARLYHVPPSFYGYIATNSHSIVSLIVELLPATLVLPFVPWPWRRDRSASCASPIVAPLLLYSGVCTAVLVLWPGFNGRYAMPIAPGLAVLAGIGWDALEKSKYSAFRQIAVTLLCTFIVYQFILVAIIMPLFAERFGHSRRDGQALTQAIRGAPAPAYCFSIDTNQLFYVREPLQCLDLTGQKSLTPPSWLLISRSAVAAFAELRPDLDVRVVVETKSGPQLTATRVEKK